MGSIKKNFLYNLVLTVSNILFPVITFPYASRILGPEGIGKVQFVTNFSIYFVLVAALGIPLYGIREVAKYKSEPERLKRLFTELFVLNFLTSMAMLAVYISVVLLSPKLYTDHNYYVVAAFMLIFSAFNVDWLFSGLEQFRFIAVRSVVLKIIGMISMFILVRTKSDDIYYLGISVFSIVLNNFWNIWSARKYFHFAQWKLNNLKVHIKPLFYIFSSVAAINIYTMLDTIVLGFLTDFKAVGYYTAASRIIKITIPVLTSLGFVLIPQMSQAFKENNTSQLKYLVKSSLDFVILLGVPMTIGLIALAPEIILLFSGKEFTEAVFSMQLFAPVILVIGLSHVWSVQVLTPAGHEKAVTLSSVFGLFVSLALNFILIPRYSYLGATVANLITEIAVMTGLIYFSSRVIRINLDIKLLIKNIATCLMFFPIIYGLRLLLGSNAIFVCLVSFILCGMVFGFVQLFLIKNESFIKLINNIGNKLGVNIVSKHV